MSTDRPSISIVIPAYNEAAAIGDVVREVRTAMEGHAETWELLVIDDGSTDGTAAAAREAGATVVEMPSNRGVGAARKVGLRRARGPVVAMLDGDGTYPAVHLPELLDAMSDADMVVGARTSEQGTMRLLRRPVKWFLTKLAEYLTVTRIPDLNSGLRVFRRSAALRFMHLLPDTHSWVSTITLAFLTNGLQVRYLPIEYRKRVGSSTFHPILDTYTTLSLIGRTVMYFRPLRIFTPAAALLAVWGVSKSLYSYFVAVGRLQQADIIIVLTAVIVAALGLLADLIVVHSKPVELEGDDGS